ncbi:MAG: hypothetical protein VX438_16055, partial [Planctomycetota bacterium]|nr:hypothetical protein [Planctomycetota bacterium]
NSQIDERIYRLSSERIQTFDRQLLQKNAGWLRGQSNALRPLRQWCRVEIVKNFKAWSNIQQVW